MHARALLLAVYQYSFYLLLFLFIFMRLNAAGAEWIFVLLLWRFILLLFRVLVSLLVEVERLFFYCYFC